MKTRTGFVSNSSSSSFIVAFHRRPESILDIQGMLFDENETTFSDLYERGGYPVADIAKEVYLQLKDQDKPLDLDAMIECVCDGYIDSIYRILEREFPYDYDEKPTFEERQKRWEKRDERKRKLAYEYITEWLSKPDVFYAKAFKFEFADGDGPMDNAMEHGDLFRRLPHIVISNH